MKVLEEEHGDSLLGVGDKMNGYVLKEGEEVRS